MLSQRPAFERHHRAPDLQREPYLRERPELSTDRDDHVCRTNDRQVPRVPRTRSHRVGEVLVRPPPVLVRQDTDGRPTGLRGAACCSLHHAFESPAYDRSAPLGDEPPDLAGLLVELAGRFARTDDGYVGTR